MPLQRIPDAKSDIPRDQVFEKFRIERPGKIVFVGSKADAEKLKGAATVVNDLQGKTLLPGFIDTHVHWGQFVLLSALDRVSPAEVGNVDAYLKHMKEVAAKTPEGEWVINYGYEKLMVPPYRNLTREDLDRVSTKHPVFALYNNFHWATAKTAALHLFPGFPPRRNRRRCPVDPGE